MKYETNIMLGTITKREVVKQLGPKTYQVMLSNGLRVTRNNLYNSFEEAKQAMVKWYEDNLNKIKQLKETDK